MLKRISLLAVLYIPLSSPDGWHHLTFKKKTPNQVTHQAQGLEIQVDSSASPLFYKLSRPQRVGQVRLAGTVDNVPKLVDGRETDDFVLRVGLVTEGTRHLGWFEKWFAPDWLKKLIQLAPDQGLGKVTFLILSRTRELGDTRSLSSQAEMSEIVAGNISGPGPFAAEYSFQSPLDTFAIWLQADGDDSKSKFKVQLQSLALMTGM